MNWWESRRIELGLSQRKLAAKLGIANTTVGLWERDERIPHCPIPTLAGVYAVPEAKIERELIGMRRRMEAVATTGK